jgi:SAM-dependent methyltransferase
VEYAIDYVRSKLKGAQAMTLKMLDVGCGLGGMSEGFAAEGFEVTGIDIANMKELGYKYNFIQADICELNGENFRGYDVIHVSMPCRDFSPLARCYGKNWKIKPNPERGLILVNKALKFIEAAAPRFWTMENVFGLTGYLKIQPKISCYIRYKKHGFWGDFPAFLMPRVTGQPMTKGQYINGMRCPQPRVRRGNSKIESWNHAKIPLVVSRSFAKACKETLEPQIMLLNMSEVDKK